MKNYSIIILLFASIQVSGQTILTTEQYIAEYKDVAESEMRRTGVPAAISLAQGILESDSGNGLLARNSNNQFGIKCKGGWTGQTVAYTDDARDECFRKYDNPLDSWYDHSNFLRSTPRYAFLFQLKPTDYTGWAYGLKAAGYATSPVYAQRLIQEISDYNLQQYTLAVIDGGQTDIQNNNLQFISFNSGEDSSQTGSAPVSRNYPVGVFTINGIKVVYLSKGTTLLPLAEQYSIKLRNLVSYNDLDDDQPLQSDMLIFLEKKATFGAEDYHIVQPGEDMQEIAQQEGIQLKWLLKRNKMEPGDEPVPGEKLYLTGFASQPPALMPPPVEAANNPAPKVSITGMVRNFKNTVRMVLNRDRSNPSQTPIPAEPVLDSNSDKTPFHQTDYALGYSGPSRRQWPDTSLTGVSPDSSIPKSSNEVMIDRDNPPPHRNWPKVKMSTNRAGYHYHIVRHGETLYGISREYGVTVSDLKLWNRLNGPILRTGQSLIIARH
ncbi:MAG TPA: glucosaminidase domain-containing protein [Chitinophagaceae bacterium]|nr:glucosaminidase domain-containing protein [Chitinophagaceae bacterium]